MSLTSSRPVYSDITVRNSSARSTFDWPALLPVETQRLQGDLGNPRQLILGYPGILLHVLHGLRVPHQIQQIRNGLEGVVDLMSNRRRQLPHGSQFL